MEQKTKPPGDGSGRCAVCRSVVGIVNINEALFLVRDDRQDLLWSLTTHSEKTTRENLDARESGDPAWIKSEITCGCVAGAPREGTQSRAATRLLDALVPARVPYQFPRPPYLPGLLASAELSDIAVTGDVDATEQSGYFSDSVGSDLG